MESRKKITEDELDLIGELRTAGWEWTKIGQVMGKHPSTIAVNYRKHRGEPPKIKRVMDPNINRSGKIEVERKPGEILPSWNGQVYICCNSFLRGKHFPGCPNVAGTWGLPKMYLTNYRDRRAVSINKYDKLLDEPVKIGKSYQQYLLEK